jgi:transcriptional regulator with XRE-family HTH domain
MEQPNNILAHNLQTLRETRNLSLSQLAELTGVSKSMLRQIEIGQSSPTIATIWKIANGLHIPFTALLQRPEMEVTVQAFTANTPLRTGAEGYRLYPLVMFEPQHPFEIYYLEVDPGIAMDADAHSENAEEYVFVQQGELTITVNEQSYTITKDHFIKFQANVPHHYENQGNKMTTVTMMIAYSS